MDVEAGALHGVTENTVLKLSASEAADGPEWGRAVVNRAEPIRSTGTLSERPASGLPQSLWARISTPGISYVLTVAEPPQEELDSGGRRLIEESKAQLVRFGGGALEWVSAQQPAADVRLRVKNGRLWLLPPDGEWVTEESQLSSAKLRVYPITPSYPVAGNAAATDVAKALHAIARARNMVRLAETENQTHNAADRWSALKVTAARLPSRTDDKNPHRACPDFAQISESELNSTNPIDLAFAQPVFHCDLITVAVLNTGRTDVDVNLSYIDATSGITPLGRECTVTIPGTANPAEAKPIERRVWVTTWNGKTNTPDSIGREHIVVTAVERKGGLQADLCFIQDAVRGVERGQSRGGPVAGKAGWLLRALQQAALALSTTRGVEVVDDSAPDAPRAGMYLITLQVTPPLTP